MKKYWYFLFTQECPICGHYRESRERRYGTKPKNWVERRSFSYIAYHCNY